MSRQPHVRQFSLRWRLNAPRIETGQSWFRAARPAETLRPLQQVFEILRARRQWGNAVYFSRLTRRSRLPVAKLRQLPGRRRARPRPPFAALRSKLRKKRRNRPNDGRFPAGLRPTKFGHARQSPSAWKPRLSVIAGMIVLGVSACDALPGRLDKRDLDQIRARRSSRGRMRGLQRFVEVFFARFVPPRPSCQSCIAIQQHPMRTIAGWKSETAAA